MLDLNSSTPTDAAKKGGLVLFWGTSFFFDFYILLYYFHVELLTYMDFSDNFFRWAFNLLLKVIKNQT